MAEERACEHRRPNEDPCGALAPYVIAAGQRRHDAQASCERHLGDTVATLAYAEEPHPDITVTAPAPLLRALTDAADARDRFREQARILGEEKAEWLCEACEVIHPWRDGDRFTAACPDCTWPMVPTSTSLRSRQVLQGRAEAAEARLAELDALCRGIRSSAPQGATPIVAVERVLAITGTEGETGQPSKSVLRRIAATEEADA